MAKMKTTNFDDYLKEALKNPATKREYEKLRPWFNREVVRMRSRITAEHLGREIQELRKEKKLSQRKLAEKVGTTQEIIAKIELGKYTRLSFTLVHKIAQALDTYPEIHLKKNEKYKVKLL